MICDLELIKWGQTPLRSISIINQLIVLERKRDVNRKTEVWRQRVETKQLRAISKKLYSTAEMIRYHKSANFIKTITLNKEFVEKSLIRFTLKR